VASKNAENLSVVKKLESSLDIDSGVKEFIVPLNSHPEISDERLGYPVD